MRLIICLVLGACAPSALLAQGCPTYLLFSPEYLAPEVPSEGGMVSIPVGHYAVSPCTWTAASTAGWLEVLTPTGNLPGTLQVSVAPNTGAPRFTYLQVGGKSLYFSQLGPCCEYPYLVPGFVAKRSASSQMLSATVLFKCSTGMECPWSTTTSGGATMLSPTSGKGNTTISFSTAVNCTDRELQGRVSVNQSTVGYFQVPTEWQYARLVLSPSALTFQSQVGDANPPASRAVSVASGSSICPGMPFEITAPNAPWLRLSAVGWTTTPDIAVTVDPTGLAPGTYDDFIDFMRSGAGRVRLTVTFLVLPRAEPVRLIPAPASVAFVTRAGDPPPLPRSVSISAPGVSTALLVTPPAGNWVTATVTGRTPAAQITVTPQPQGRLPGLYTGLLQVQSADLPAVAVAIPVSLSIRPEEADREEEPELFVTDEVIQVEVEPPYAPMERRVRLTSNRSLDITTTVQPAGLSWLRLTPATGVTPYDLRIEIVPATLAAGTHEAVIALTANGVSKTIRVRCTVIPPVRLLPAETSVNLTSAAPAHTFYVTATGRSVSLTAAVDSPWLTVTPATGQTPINLQLRAAAGTLAPGLHSAWLTLAGASSTVRIPVFFDIPPPPPTLAPIGSTSPGAWLQIDGANLAVASLAAALPLPLTLGGATVLLDGAPIPIHSIERTSILAQIPGETPEGRSTLAVRTVSGTSNAVELVIAPTSPAILAIDAARAGQPVVIYANGLGALRSGICQHVVRVEFAGVPAELLFAGAAPGQPGLYQVNAVVPVLPPGTYPVQLFAAGAASARVNIRVE